jgi:hypothetical protein
MYRAKASVVIGNGQTQRGEGEHYAALVPGAYEESQAGGDREQRPSAFVQQFPMREQWQTSAEQRNHQW